MSCVWFWLSQFQVMRPKTSWRAGSTCGAVWARGGAAGAAGGARGPGAEVRGGALGTAGGACAGADGASGGAGGAGRSVWWRWGDTDSNRGRTEWRWGVHESGGRGHCLRDLGARASVTGSIIGILVPGVLGRRSRSHGGKSESVDDAICDCETSLEMRSTLFPHIRIRYKQSIDVLVRSSMVLWYRWMGSDKPEVMRIAAGGAEEEDAASPDHCIASLLANYLCTEAPLVLPSNTNIGVGIKMGGGLEDAEPLWPRWDCFALLLCQFGFGVAVFDFWVEIGSSTIATVLGVVLSSFVFGWFSRILSHRLGSYITIFHFDRLGLQFRMGPSYPILDQNYQLTRQPGFPGVALLNPFLFVLFTPTYTLRQLTENSMPTANFVWECQDGYRVQYDFDFNFFQLKEMSCQLLQLWRTENYFGFGGRHNASCSLIIGGNPVLTSHSEKPILNRLRSKRPSQPWCTVRFLIQKI
ncbi:hypothetical protein B0H13DRAFT_1909386 [Mycena leptocephala]|nr:hypothetical protein B0H13DRAFT_1909386 [Mycena leptocephala]